jgi:putative transposase
MFPRICSHYQYKLIEVNGEADHINLLIECPPTASLSSLVGDSSTSLFLKRYGAQCWRNHKHTLWNSGYFVASTGGVTLGVTLETLRRGSKIKLAPNPPQSGGIASLNYRS